MHTELHPRFAATAEGQAAADLIKACVHCGFCLPTCPTYRELRDERDSPRGRIYLIKHVLESGQATAATQLHLDRCLTCRNCETACPSGMRYGELLDIGRSLIEEEAPRSPYAKGFRWLLRTVLSSRALMSTALALGRCVRPLLPARLRTRIPPLQARTAVPRTQHARKMLILEGCVQGAATPNTNDAARRVMDTLGITLVAARGAGCCGAVNYHLAAHEDGLDDMRRNIDAWWPDIQSGAEAIVSSASGCGAMLVDYARLLAGDPAYAEKARRVSALARDLGDILLGENLDRLQVNTRIGKVAIHTPCTLQHALQRPALLPTLLKQLGFEIAEATDTIGCCGSAGTYSVLQPHLSERLRHHALLALTGNEPTLIATANIGCQLHLQAASSVPVVHWIELLDSR